MLDIGWSELILVGVVALIVIGPKDLPDMFRELGRFTAKMRSMAREFSRAMEQAANESGIKDVAKDLKSVTSQQSLGLTAMKDAAAKFEKWDPLKNAATPTKAPSKPTDPAPVSPVIKPPVGPETQALLDKQAARQAIVADSTERLRALNGAGNAAPLAPSSASAVAAPNAPAKPKPRTRAAKPAGPATPAASATSATITAAKPAPKPIAKRKLKKADEA